LAWIMASKPASPSQPVYPSNASAGFNDRCCTLLPHCSRRLIAEQDVKSDRIVELEEMPHEIAYRKSEGIGPDAIFVRWDTATAGLKLGDESVVFHADLMSEFPLREALGFAQPP